VSGPAQGRRQYRGRHRAAPSLGTVLAFAAVWSVAAGILLAITVAAVS
jgi:hypothetical protein